LTPNFVILHLGGLPQTSALKRGAAYGKNWTTNPLCLGNGARAELLLILKLTAVSTIGQSALTTSSM